MDIGARIHVSGRPEKGVILQEIAKSLGMNRSNVYRYLKTLVDCGC